MTRVLHGLHQHRTIQSKKRNPSPHQKLHNRHQCPPGTFPPMKTIPLRLACRILETVDCEYWGLSRVNFAEFKGAANNVFLTIDLQDDWKTRHFRFLEGENQKVKVNGDEMTLRSEAGDEHRVRFFNRTPQNIESLTKENLGLVVTPDMVQRFLDNPAADFFDDAEDITDAASAMLGVFQGEELRLNGLKTISKKSAAHLANFQGKKLTLDGLLKLELPTAKELAKFRGDILSLNGLSQVDEAMAETLATFQGKVLFLFGLLTLTEFAARYLATFKGQEIALFGLRSLDRRAAENLAEFSGGIFISYVICDDGVNFLLNAKRNAYIDIDVSGLRKLDEKLARRLARQGQVFFYSLRSIEPAEARILCEEGSNLDNIEFSSLRSLSLESCYELGKTYVSELTLGGIDEFTDEHAQALTAFRRIVVSIVTAFYRNLPPETVDIEDVPATLLSELAAEIPKRKEELDALYSFGKGATLRELMRFMECFVDHNLWPINFSLPDVQSLSDSAFKILNDAGFNIDPPRPLATETTP